MKFAIEYNELSRNLLKQNPMKLFHATENLSLELYVALYITRS